MADATPQEASMNRAGKSFPFPAVPGRKGTGRQSRPRVVERYRDLDPASPFHPVDLKDFIYETGECLAFYDRYPVSKGHALVVPKTVVRSIYELNPEQQAELWFAVRQARELIAVVFKPDGFNIGINDGEAAGQTIPHAHIHIIPRYRGDVPDPRGGIRRVLPDKAKYWQKSTI